MNLEREAMKAYLEVLQGSLRRTEDDVEHITALVDRGYDNVYESCHYTDKDTLVDQGLALLMEVDKRLIERTEEIIAQCQDYLAQHPEEGTNEADSGN